MCQSTHGYGKKTCTGPGRVFFFYVQRQENWSCNISHYVFQHTSQDHQFYLLDTTVISSLTTPKNVTYRGAISQPQMNPGQFSLAAFTPFTLNVLMRPLLVHCAKTSDKRKYKSLVKLQKKPFYILMQASRGVQGHTPLENFEILGRGRCDFLHFGAKILVQTNTLTHPK